MAIVSNEIQDILRKEGYPMAVSIEELRQTPMFVAKLADGRTVLIKEPPDSLNVEITTMMDDLTARCDNCKHSEPVSTTAYRDYSDRTRENYVVCDSPGGDMEIIWHANDDQGLMMDIMVKKDFHCKNYERR